MECATACWAICMGLVALLPRGLVGAAVALALRQFPNSPLSPAKGYHSPCSPLLSKYSPCSQAFLLFDLSLSVFWFGLFLFLLFFINSLMDRCSICLCVSISVAVGYLQNPSFELCPLEFEAVEMLAEACSVLGAAFSPLRERRSPWSWCVNSV